MRLSARPVIAGRGLALRPGRSGIAFAPGLADPQARERIRGELLKPVLPAEVGLAVARAAAGLPAEVLRTEARRLSVEWSGIAARAGAGSAPALLSPGPDAIGRALFVRLGGCGNGDRLQ